MKTDKAIRWGVMGTGWVAQRFLADLSRTQGASLYAVASRTKTRAIEVADRFNVERAHSSYDDLIQDSGVDVVYVATAPHEHAAHCILALEQGKHVLCEKPFAASLEEASRVVETAKRTGRFCMEAMWSRFLPGMTEAKRRVDAGDIGTPTLLTADFGIPVAPSGTDRFFDPEKGGGALLDRGVYPLSFATWLFGKPTRVFAAADMHALGADKSVTAVLAFADNRMASISASLTAQTSNRAVIAGTTGRLTLDEPFYRPERLIVSRAPSGVGQAQGDLNPSSPKERLRRIIATAKPYVPFDMHRAAVSHHPVSGYGYGYEASEVIRCIEEGLSESPVMPLRDTLLVMSVVAEIQRQLKESR